jgi:glycosyltransferase involved in cell wall biosynthesis
LRHVVYLAAGIYEAIRLTRAAKRQRREVVVVADVLAVTLALSAAIASRLLGLRRIGLVTDLPSTLVTTAARGSWVRNLAVKVARRASTALARDFDGYVFLTEQMNEVLNPEGKPCVVVEGFADLALASRPNRLSEKHRNRIVLYAGALYDEYGVLRLARAFSSLPHPDAELWLYGTGSALGALEAIARADPRIRVLGLVPNEVVVAEELRATLLVNPRPTDQEFTKYSFPSKNMEYMASGTPLLTTRLPGMPREYHGYVYLFEDETEAGMARRLGEVLSLDREVLHRKGAAAREFVLGEKNNVVQAQRIVDLARQIGRW